MTEKPLNILLITSDQQHWNTLGCLNPEIQTPNLDRLSREGTLFERAYCPNPTCTPTRASIITGKYPSQHGAWSLGTKLPEDEPTVGDRFQSEAYDVSLIGKAHFQQLISTEEYPSLESYPCMQDLNFWKHFQGPFYGFNHIEIARNHVDEPHVGQHYALWMEEQGLSDWRKHFQNTFKTFDFTEGGEVNPPQEYRWSLPEAYHYNTWIADRTHARMEKAQQENTPFFLWASFFDPHPPYLAPEPWDTMYDPDAVTVPEVTPGEHDRNPPHFGLTQEENPDFSPWKGEQINHGFHSHRRDREALAKDIAVYYGMTSLLDKYVGKILNSLDALGLAENTLVVFTSDHGHFYGQHGLTAKGPFHYEDVIRVPFLVRLPGKVPAGKRSSALQSLVDLPQTFLEACGMEEPPGMAGVSQWKTWTGDVAAARDHITVENRHQEEAIHVKTYVDSRYKITVYYNRTYGELFDLEADPGETHNLWDDPGSQDLKARLMMQLIHAEMGKEPLRMPRVTHA